MGLFPTINDLALSEARAFRAELLRAAHGRVVEIGFGTGLNAEHYRSGDDAVEQVLAVEPSDDMWKRAEKRVAEAAVPIERIAADAAKLPFASGSVDSVVSTFVLCSVASPGRVLAEVARVLAPGGSLLLLEHVRHPGAFTARMQRLVTPAWRVLFRGCQPGRDLAEELAAAAFVSGDARHVRFPWLPRLLEEHLIGQFQDSKLSAR